jgi:hypothetical protein
LDHSTFFIGKKEKENPADAVRVIRIKAHFVTNQKAR